MQSGKSACTDWIVDRVSAGDACFGGRRMSFLGGTRRTMMARNKLPNPWEPNWPSCRHCGNAGTVWSGK